MFLTLADLGCCSGMGDGFVIYADVQTALKQPQAYGYLYNQGGQIYMTGPAGPLTVRSTTVYPDSTQALKQPGAYGYIYVQDGKYWLSGPYGPLSVRSPYTTSAESTGPLLELPPPPASSAFVPTPPPTPAPAPKVPVDTSGKMIVVSDPTSTSNPTAPDGVRPTGYVPPSSGGKLTKKPVAKPASNVALYAVLGLAGAAGLLGIVLIARAKKAKKAAAKSQSNKVA